MSFQLNHYRNRDPSKRICARGLCILGDKVLVVKRTKYGDTYYVLPGGGIDRGETDVDAATREVLEETSVATKGHKVILTIPGSSKHSEQRIVQCKYIEGDPQLPEDSEEAHRTDEGRNTYEPMWIDIELAREVLVPAVLRSIL